MEWNLTFLQLDQVPLDITLIHLQQPHTKRVGKIAMVTYPLAANLIHQLWSDPVKVQVNLVKDLLTTIISHSFPQTNSNHKKGSTIKTNTSNSHNTTTISTRIRWKCPRSLAKRSVLTMEQEGIPQVTSIWILRLRRKPVLIIGSDPTINIRIMVSTRMINKTISNWDKT